MRGITSILNHVKWMTLVVLTSSYQVLTELPESRLASIKPLLDMIDDPNNPLESIDLASIYELLAEDLNLFVMCPLDCIQKLLNQAHWLESNMSVTRSIGFSQWLMVLSAGSVMDIARSCEPFKLMVLFFLEFMPCSKNFPPLNLDIIMKTLSNLSRNNMTKQAFDSPDWIQKTARINDSSIQAKIQVLTPSHVRKYAETIGKIGKDSDLEVMQQLYPSSTYGFRNRTLIVGTLQEYNISAYHKVWRGVEKGLANEPDWLSLDGDEHMRRVVETQYAYIADEIT